MRLFIIILLFSLTNLFAQSNAEVSIDAQIAVIKNAEPSQRVKLMNAFKIRVSKMNSQERALAIQKIHSKMNSQSITTQKNHALQMQIQNNSQIMNHQNMNQKQSVSQGSGMKQHGPGNNKGMR